MAANLSIEQQAENMVPVGLVSVPLSSFMDTDPTTIRYAVYPALPRQVVTILGGHGGAGKSNCALTVAAHGACGSEWLGFSPEGAVRSLFVSLEDSGDLIRYRLRRICESYQLDPARVEQNIRVLDGSDSAAAMMVEVNDLGIRRMQATAVLEGVAAAAAQADIIFIDNASDAFDGNENERRSVRGFLRELTKIAKENGAAVVLLVHIDKQAARNGSQGNSYSGSTAWHNSARSRLALVANDDGTVELRHEKNNLGRKADPVRLCWNDHGVLVPLTAAMSQGRIEADSAIALRVLVAARQSGLRVPVAASGPATAWQAVSHLPELGDLSEGKDARRRFHAALDALHRAGRIQRVSFKDKYRNAREAWELTQAAECVGAAALRQSPIPPVLTNARTGDGSVTTNAQLTRTNATNAAAYRAAKDGDQ